LSGAASQFTIIVTFIIQTVCFDGMVPVDFYQGIVVYCLMYTVASLIVFRTLPAAVANAENNGHVGIQMLLRTAKDSRYRLMLAAAAGQFLIGVPLLAVYAVTVLEVPAEFLGVVLVLRTVTSFLATPLLGWLIHITSAQSIVRASGFALCIQMIVWTLIPVVGHRFVLLVGLAALVVVFQASKVAFSIALATVEYETIRPTERVGVFTLIDVTSSTAMQLNMLVGAVLVEVSASAAIISTGLLRLDAVKLSCALGACVAALLTVGYVRLAGAIDPTTRAVTVH
jgi:hypothetical protein